MSMDTVAAVFHWSLEEFRRKSLGAISTMSTLNYILSITVYILARDVKSTPTYGAYMWRRPRNSRVG